MLLATVVQGIASACKPSSWQNTNFLSECYLGKIMINMRLVGRSVWTCMMYHMDHDMQLAAFRIDPIIQFSFVVELLPWILNRGFQIFRMTDPLYNVMAITPPNEIMVPRTFASPRGFHISRTSILHAFVSIRNSFGKLNRRIKV